MIWSDDETITVQVRRREVHHGNVVTQLVCVSPSRFNTGIGDHSSKYKVANAALLQLVMQIGVLKGTYRGRLA